MTRAQALRAAAVWLGSGALWLAGCAAPGESGELLYRKGDLRGAIEAWRADDSAAHAPRIAQVEAEIDARVSETAYAPMIDPEAPAQRAGVLASLNMVADTLKLLPPEHDTTTRWSAATWSKDMSSGNINTFCSMMRISTASRARVRLW